MPSSNHFVNGYPRSFFGGSVAEIESGRQKNIRRWSPNSYLSDLTGLFWFAVRVIFSLGVLFRMVAPN
ncbi:hypothetical protein BVI434_180032 [Burkholderia vietnamiensis]|nr:hypothetical protein BVI434_180032 [Burkholderia vietnamiensis]